MGRVYGGVGPAWAAYNEKGVGRGSKRSARVSFEGRVIYSYSTAIACYHTSASGEKYVLMSSNHWSRSTSSHMSHAGGSARVPVFRVRHIGLHGEGGDMHNLNLEILIAGFMEAVAQAENAWKGSNWWTSDDNWHDWLGGRHSPLVEYKRLTGATLELPDLHRTIGQVDAERQRRRAEFFAPKAVERRERQKARREAMKALKLLND